MPFFVSNETLDDLALKARQFGYQEGYSDGQKFGEQSAHAQCLELGFRFRVAFEVDLNQPQILPRPTSYPMLLDQLYLLAQEAKYRWERVEQKLATYQRDYNQETWKTLSDELLRSQDKAKSLDKDLADARSQIDIARQYAKNLEKTIWDLERKIQDLGRKIRDQDCVIAGLQNTVDRANKQGK